MFCTCACIALAVAVMAPVPGVHGDAMMMSLYQETLEEELGLQEGEWSALTSASSRGDTKASLAVIAKQCARHGRQADLSAWVQLLELFGLFKDGAPHRGWSNASATTETGSLMLDARLMYVKDLPQCHSAAPIDTSITPGPQHNASVRSLF